MLWAGYSYSDPGYTYGYTPNAITNGYSWSMDNVLPSAPGLDINGVIYRYRTVKDPDDPMKVHVQNENANGNGYIFRETDDWSGVPGNSINKLVSIDNIPRSNWGDGSIEIEGIGTVEEPSVIYTYRVDPCFNPQLDPACDGYIPPPQPNQIAVDVNDLYNALDDDAVKNAMKEYDDGEIYDEEEKENNKEDNEKEKSKSRLEKAMSAVDNNQMMADAFAQAQMLQAMNNAIPMNSYYVGTIDGGTYNETVTLDGGQIRDNPAGRRNNMAQQKLHKDMVDMQY